MMSSFILYGHLASTGHEAGGALGAGLKVMDRSPPETIQRLYVTPPVLIWSLPVYE